MLTYTFAKGSGEPYTSSSTTASKPIFSPGGLPRGRSSCQADACRPSGAVGHHGEERL